MPKTSCKTAADVNKTTAAVKNKIRKTSSAVEEAAAPEHQQNLRHRRERR
jgi:hypothetical protein